MKRIVAELDDAIDLWRRARAALAAGNKEKSAVLNDEGDRVYERVKGKREALDVLD
jgi:hypothetical protein